MQCRVHPLLSMLPLRFPLSRQDAALAHLDSLPSHNLVIWTDGSVFFLSKATLASLPTAHFVALRPHFPFWPAQYVQVFQLNLCHSATSSLVLAAPTSLPFFFSSLPLRLSLCSYHFVLSSIFPFSSNCLADLEGTVSFTIRPQWVP